METIYYTSDLKWFGKITTDKYASKREMVAHHLSYTTEKAEYILGNKEEFLRKVELADKRVNSRVAFSFVFALPNDLKLSEVKQWTKDIRQRISNLFGMNEEDILIAYHDDIGVSGEPNKHIHIAGLNLASDGKSLRINQKELRQLHKELQGYIKSQGYKIRKDNENERIGHIGTRLRWDIEKKEEYQEYVKTKKEKREKENELRKRVRNAILNRNYQRERVIREIEKDISGFIRRAKEKYPRYTASKKGEKGTIDRDRGLVELEREVEKEYIRIARASAKRNEDIEKIERIKRNERERDREYRERIKRIRKQLEELERLKKQEEERKNKTVYIDIFGKGTEEKKEPKKEHRREQEKENKTIHIDIWSRSNTGKDFER